jgi:hypothetical protein
MTQAQATIAGIAAGKQALSDVDRQQVAAVSASLDQAVSTSAAQIFATARPSTVALLRSQAAMVGVPLTTVGMAK